MKIVCLGWGSLIWDPRELKIKNNWFLDGPKLPIEFTRISADNRITLIIDKDAELDIRCLWGVMNSNDLNEAIFSLQRREKIKDIKLIHRITIADEANDDITSNIKEWMKLKNVDAAIWTGLSYSKKTDFKRPNINELKEHLWALSDEDFNIAEEYIKNAPQQIVTTYRRELEGEIQKILAKKQSI